MHKITLLIDIFMLKYNYRGNILYENRQAHDKGIGNCIFCVEDSLNRGS